MENGEALPFSEKAQDAVLGWLVTDWPFFLLCKDRIKPAWFNAPANQKIWAVMLDFFATYKKLPTVDEIKEQPAIRCDEVKVRNTINARLISAINETQFYRLDPIKDRLREWLQVHVYLEHMQNSADLFNKGDIYQSFQIARAGIRKVDDIKFDETEEYNWKSYETYFNEAIHETDNALTFGIDIMDHLLLEGAKKGALLRGDTTAILAPTNIGKTTAMITIARHNVSLGADVLFLTHEGRPADIGEKIWQSILVKTRPELREMYVDPAKIPIMRALSETLARQLTYLPLNRAGLTIEEVESIIRRKIEEKVAKTGKGYDLVIDDYPAKLFTAQNRFGKLEKRQADDLVYNYFVNLALEYKFHAVVAIQSNREGSKVNRGQFQKTSWGQKNDNRLLTPEDVNESFGPMQTATNVITMNRDPAAAAAKRLTYLICKSRGNETGFAVVCNTDYARAVTHSNQLGGTWYRGTSSMSQRVDDFLAKYRGQQVPDSVLAEAATSDPSD